MSSWGGIGRSTRRAGETGTEAESESESETEPESGSETEAEPHTGSAGVSAGMPRAASVGDLTCPRPQTTGSAGVSPASSR